MRLLSPRPGETAVDCTTGLGGHAAALAMAVGPGGLVVGFDVDEGNLSAAAPKVAAAGGARLLALRANFADAPRRLAEQGLRADLVLADLGFSSNQIEDAARWLQERVLEHNRNALLGDAGIDNLYARRYREGRLHTVPASDVRAGDELWVAPGDVAPVAASVLGEPASVSLEWISGESHPVAVDPGGTVPAGAFNVSNSDCSFSSSIFSSRPFFTCS